MRTILSLFVVLLFVAGCGGGSDGGENQQPVAQDELPECPFSNEEERGAFYQDPDIGKYEEYCEDGQPVEFRCTYQEDGYTITTGIQTSIGTCKELHKRELGIPLEESSRGKYDECANADELHNFFNAVFLGKTRIERFDASPELSLAEGTTDFQKDIVWRAAGFLNSSLPEEYRIRVNPMYIPARSSKPPNGEIYVDFAPKGEWQNVGNSDLEGVIALAREYSSSGERSVHVWVDPEYIQIRFLKGKDGFEERANKNVRDGNNIGLLSHELLHALGFPGHVGAQTVGGVTFGNIPSIMTPYAQITGGSTTTGETRIRIPFKNLLRDGLLTEVDRAGLRYLYEELETGDSPQNIEEADLDAWLTEKDCFSQ